jgi:hypothetical protein
MRMDIRCAPTHDVPLSIAARSSCLYAAVTPSAAQTRTIGIVAGCYLVCFVTALLYRLA